MLAIGIGVNVAAFGFFNLVVLHPLPIRDPATLLKFHRVSPQHASDNLPFPVVAFYREHSQTLSTVLAVRDAALALRDDQQPIAGQFVTAHFFQELGGTAILGRTLDPLDDASGARAVVVLSSSFWRRRYAGDETIVGQSIVLNGRPVAVVGVASQTFSGLSLDVPEVWVPMTQLPDLQSSPHLLTDFSGCSTDRRLSG